MNRKLNILIIAHYFPPVRSNAFLRPYSWAKYWSEAGHNVFVITTKKAAYKNRVEFSGNYNVIEVDFLGQHLVEEQKRLDADESAKKGPLDNIKLTILNWLRSFVHLLSSKLSLFSAERIPEPFFFWKRNAMKEIVKIQSDYGIDCIVSTYAPPSAHILAYRIKKRFPEVKWISDYRDSWTTYNYIHPGFPVIRNVEKRIENKIIREADIITVVSLSLMREFKTRFPGSRVELIENGFFDDLDNLENIELNGEIKMVYTGSYGGYRSLAFLDDFLKRLKHDDNQLYQKLNVYVVGKGREDFVNEKIFFVGELPYEKSLAYQRAADVLFLVESDNEIAKWAIPGKLFEYLSAKKPIIAFGPTEDSDLAKYLRETGAEIGRASCRERVYACV